MDGVLIMRVEVLKAFATFSVGHVIPEMPGGQARTLIERGFVREVGPARPVAAAMAAPVDRMMRPNVASAARFERGPAARSTGKIGAR